MMKYLGFVGVDVSESKEIERLVDDLNCLVFEFFEIR